MDGYGEISLDRLKDQLVHDVWMDLRNQKGQIIPGKLHLMVQWTHSNLTFYADFLARIQEKINYEQAEKARLEQLLDNIRGILTCFTF